MKKSRDKDSKEEQQQQPIPLQRSRLQRFTFTKVSIIIIICLSFMMLTKGVNAQCEPDEYMDTTCKKCQNIVYGCNKCTYASGFITCNECSEGLYLLRNYTYSASYPTQVLAYLSTMTFCVPDCRLAHSSFVNDFSTMKCQWCGEYCASCNLKHGCESCLPNTQTSPVVPWSWTNVYTTGANSLKALVTTPTGAEKNPLFSGSFLECRRCGDTKRCRNCLNTNPNSCTSCKSSEYTFTGSACNYNQYNTGYSYDASSHNYFQQCMTWGGDYYCDVCQDEWSIGFISGYDFRNCGGCGSNGLYRGCRQNTQSSCIVTVNDQPSNCQICKDYYGEYYYNDGNTYCAYCLATSNTFYFEMIKCSSTNSALNYAPIVDGCRDGYQKGGRCTSTCGIGYYGLATFNDRSNLDRSWCDVCDGSCYECTGAGPSNCISCDFNYYLDNIDPTNQATNAIKKSTGTCTIKETYGTFSFELFVNPVSSWSASDVQNQDGTFGNAFNQLQDAIKKAYEMAAPFKSAEMIITLKTGTHAMIRSNNGFYMPNRFDDWSQNVKLTIRSQDPAAPVTVRYKLRDSFKFLVGGGLTIENVIFQAADSINTPHTQAQINCLANPNVDCCLSGGALSLTMPAPSPIDMTNSICFFPRKPTEQCYMPQGASLFYFDLSATPRRTQLTDPPTLTLKGCKFLNFLYEFNSFIELNDHGGKVVIEGTDFENMNTCGAIIRNKRYLYRKTNYPSFTSMADAQNDRQRNYAYELLTQKYNAAQSATNIFTCESAAIPKCFSITITGSSFKYFGKLKTPMTVPTYVDSALNLQYSGSVLDLDNFQGDVKVTFTSFTENVLSYQTCDVAQEMFNNIIINHQNFDINEYSEFKSSSKDKLQIRSVISIVNHGSLYKIEIVKNDFQKNSGTKGIIYLDTQSRAQPVIIAHNTFNQNAGFIDSSVVFIRARAATNTATPNDLAVFCAGFHFESNIWTNNFACPYYGGSIVSLECINSGTTSSQANDRMTYTTLTSTQETAWYTAATYTDTAVTSSYTYLTTTVSVAYEIQKTQFKSDQFLGNYASGGKGLLDFTGIPRIFITSVTFTNNGDSIREVITNYGAVNGGYQINQVSNNEMTIAQAYAGTFSSTYFCQGLIKIRRARQLHIIGSRFERNWLLEYTHNANRAQLATLSDFFGEFKIDDIQVKNQRGMFNIPAILGGVGLVPTSDPLLAINIIASMQPLFKWKLTDQVRFKPLLTTGTSSEFSDIYYHQFPVYTDRLFWPGLTYDSTTVTFIADEVKFISVKFNNIQCYGCQLSPLFIHTQNFEMKLTTVTNINNLAYNAPECSTFTYRCKQTRPFFEFQLRDALTLASFDQIKVDQTQIQNYWGGCSNGRLFDIVALYAGIGSISTVQVQFLDSKFSQIYFDCHGAFLRADMRYQQLRIEGRAGSGIPKTFETVYSRYTSSPGYGGVLYIVSLSKLFLDNIKVEDIRVGQTTATNGGGRFLYYKQDNQNLNIDLRSSEIRCSSLATVFDATVQKDTKLPGSQYDQGSAIHAESSSNSIVLDMQDTTIEHCFNSLQGGAIFMTTTGQKTLRLSRNTFAYNAALSGGAIYCEKCTWETMLQNTFRSNYAQYGGDLYIKEARIYPINLQSQVHDSSVALSSGAAIYLQDTRSAAAIGLTSPSPSNFPKLQITKSASGGTSEFKDNDCNPSGCSGGAISIHSVETVSITVSETTFLSNRAGANGAAIYVDNSISLKPATLTLTSCIFTSNVAVTSASIFYVPNTAITSEVTIINTQFTSNSATNSDGGLFYLTATTSNTLEFQNTIGSSSVIDTASSGNNGGVFLMIGASNTIKLDERTEIKNVLTTQSGGVAHITGTNVAQQNKFELNGGLIDTSRAQHGSGGLAFMTGSAIHRFSAILTNTIQPRIKNILAASHGGALYMNGISHYLTLTQALVENVRSEGEGGFLYSTTSTTYLNAQIQATQLLSVSALSQGSIISMRKGASDPTLILNINTGSIIKCLPNDLEPNINPIIATLAGVVQTIGGAFFFDGVLSGAATITSANSQYLNCYTALSGAVFYLPPNTVFSDTGSTFKQNAAFKGTIYCQSCVATFTNSVFKDNIAQDGSVIHMLNDASALFTNPYLSHGKARRYGGAIYAGGTGSFSSGGVQMRPKITITGCLAANIINTFDAMSKGGFMYIDHPLMLLSLSGCSYEHLYALTSGGFIEGAQLKTFRMSSCTTMNNITAGTTGSFINSNYPNIAFDLQTCNFKCNPLSVPPVLATLSAVPLKGSLIELTNAASILSHTNRFEYCYTADKGSIFKVTTTASFTDTDSVFAHNAAKFGGAIYLDKTTATFTGTTFSNNWGIDGGTFYLTGQQTLTLVNNQVTSSSSSGKGGLIYATETTGLQTVTINVQKTASPGSTVDYQNIQAGLEGGAFYMNEGVSLLIDGMGTSFSNQIKFSGFSSGTNGGLIYSKSLTGITITEADFTLGSAVSNGGLIYVEKASSLQITDTKISNTQVTGLSGKGGAIYIGTTALNLLSVQLTRVTAQIVRSKSSGSIVYSDSPASASTQFTIINGLYECTAGPFTTITLTASDIGGAFWIRNALMVTSTSNTIRYCHLADTGGAFHIENSKLVDTLSVIRDNAAIKGGAITCVACTQLTLTRTNIRHHEASTAAGQGGVFYINTPTSVILDSVTILEGEAKDKGGLAFIVGTTLASTFTIENTATGAITQLETFKAGSSGGGFYVDHPLLSISMVKPVAVKDSKALSGSGGFFYFAQVGQVSIGSPTATPLSSFQDFSASVSGSFLYSVAPGLQLSVQRSTVDCTQTGLLSTSTPLDLSTTLGLAVPTNTKGGAIYINGATTPTQVNTLTLYNCHTGDKGGAFSLISTVLKDQTSRYYHNGAKQGGAVYCLDCWMELNDVEYHWSQAYEGGTFYINTLKTTVTTIPMQTLTKIYNSKAFKDGGSFYVTGGTAATKLLDLSSMSIDQTTAVENGGMMYLDNQLQSLMATSLRVTNSHSLKSGGVFYIKKSAIVTINENAGTNSLFQEFSAPDFGSFMYSDSPSMVLSITNTDVICTATALTGAPVQYTSWSTNAPLSTRAGAFHITGVTAQITSTTNIFKNCYAAKQGGIFSLINSKLQDTGSQYSSNAAIKGGIFYLEDSKIDIISADIQLTYAANGGIVYKVGKENIDFQSSKFTNTEVKMSGGIGYFAEKVGFNPADLYFITFTSPLPQVTTFTNTKADLQGGSFYFDSKQINGVTFNKVNLVNSVSTQEEGGVIYVKKIANGITILQSSFKTFTAPKHGSFLYSADIQFSLTSTSSTYDCKATNYDATKEPSQVLISTQGSIGGAFYIKDSLNGVISTMSAYRNCYTAFEGGAFFLTNTKLVDSKSKFMLNAANYGGAFKCSDCQITLTDAEVRDNDGFDGGAIHSENKITLTATRTMFYNNKAKNNGGVLSVTNKAYTILTPTIILFQQCPDIARNKADYGAFAYYDNDYAELKILDSKVTNHTAFKRSAFLEAVNMEKVTLSKTYLGDTYAPQSASMHSVAKKLDMKIIDSDIVCDNYYQDWNVYKNLNTSAMPNYTHNTKFYIESAKNVSLTKNKVKMCGTSLYGGVFQLTQGTVFYDYGSIFEYNSGANGGVINCQGCKMDLALSFFQYNQAWRGGAIELKENGYMRTRRVKFDRNTAYYSAGAIYVNTFSYMEIYENEFTNNQASENSAIEVLQSSRNKNITIEDCLFERNIAGRNTISLRDSNVAINKTTIQRNQAKYLSKHLFIGFSNVYIEDTQFKGVSEVNPRRSSLTDETLGSHIYAILSSKVFIKDTYFLEGISKLGGAMYIEGNSSIDMTRVIFQNNFARRKGGAIFANGFNLLRTSGQSKFLKNQAIEDGDDIYISNTEGYFQLESTLIDNPQAVTSISAENVNVSLSAVTIRNIGQQPNRALSAGSALNCYNCRAIQIERSQFQNLNSIRGGALYIEESEDNKLSTDTYGKYRILSSIFDSCTAVVGGAIYLNNPQYLTIGDGSSFLNNKAKNSSNERLKSMRGSGGAVYYECDENSLNCLVDIANTTFSFNYAEIKGGGIHWNTLEPIFGGITSNGNFSSIKFNKNKAGRYGDNISAFAQQIAIIDEKDFKSSMFSATSFLQQSEGFGGRRILNEEVLEPENPVEVIKNVQFKTEASLIDQRSGGSIPKMYLGLIDKYGQIVASDDDSKINVMIDAFATNKGDTSKFPPFIEGSTQYEVQNGVVQVKDVSFSATPGYNYSLRFGSQVIRPDIIAASSAVAQKLESVTNISSFSSNLLFPAQRNISSLLPNLTELDHSVTVNITLRECQAGEQFQWNGKCSQCPTNTSFSLTKMNEPGECQSCPSDRAVCYGGSNVGPAAGHWRKSNSSSNFIGCLYKPACLGMIPPLNNPQGQCAEGYQGILCADCKPGFTRSREYQCSKCSPTAWVIFRMLLIIFFVIAVVLILLQSQAKSRYFHVYLRLLINHIQLILLIAAFNYNWPESLQSFFDFARPLSQPFSEFLELDCLLQTSKRESTSNNLRGLRPVYIQVLFLGMLPIIFAICSWSAWKVLVMHEKRKARQAVQNSGENGSNSHATHESSNTDPKIIFDKNQNKNVVIKDVKSQEVILNLRGKMIQTFIILMFIAYPNIVQFMLSQFKCIDIDGELRLKVDLEIKCWHQNHSLFAYLVALPSIIVWGAGLPLLGFILLTNNRAKIIAANNPDFEETYGYLYGGFKADYYFWEIVITVRKLLLIAVCIFVTNFGVLTQALVTLLVLVLFLVLTARKRPYICEALFDLEAISLATAMISVYCGLFYLADTSQVGVHDSDKSSDLTFALGINTKRFLLSSIICVNCIFFIYWLYRVLSEMEALRGFILKSFPKLYLWCFACGDKDQAYIDNQRHKILCENDQHKEELLRILRNVKELYNRGDLLLNEEVMRKLRQHMNPEKVLQVAGIVDQNDQELTRKIQERLKSQYDIQVTNAQLTGEGFKYNHEKSAIMGSLLSDQGGDSNGPEGQMRYLQVLQALKQNQKQMLINDDSYNHNDPQLDIMGDLLLGNDFDESQQFQNSTLKLSNQDDALMNQHFGNNQGNLIQNLERKNLMSGIQTTLSAPQRITQKPPSSANTIMIGSEQLNMRGAGLPAHQRSLTGLFQHESDLVDEEAESQNIQSIIDLRRRGESIIDAGYEQSVSSMPAKEFPMVGKLMISTGNSFAQNFEVPNNTEPKKLTGTLLNELKK